MNSGLGVALELSPKADELFITNGIPRWGSRMVCHSLVSGLPAILPSPFTGGYTPVSFSIFVYLLHFFFPSAIPSCVGRVRGCMMAAVLFFLSFFSCHHYCQAPLETGDLGICHTKCLTWRSRLLQVDRFFRDF